MPSPTLSTVGWDASVGVRSVSALNNTEAEVVLLITANGEVVGATPCDDLNQCNLVGAPRCC